MLFRAVARTFQGGGLIVRKVDLFARDVLSAVPRAIGAQQSRGLWGIPPRFFVVFLLNGVNMCHFLSITLIFMLYTGKVA